MTDTFDDTDLWQMASEARLDRPTDPMQDDIESAARMYHRKMAEFQMAHQEAKQEAVANRQCYCMVMIGDRACDPALELRLSELDGYKEQAIGHLKQICTCHMAGILAHYLTHHAS
jgi:hypothetical protein